MYFSFCESIIKIKKKHAKVGEKTKGSEQFNNINKNFNKTNN